MLCLFVTDQSAAPGSSRLSFLLVKSRTLHKLKYLDNVSRIVKKRSNVHYYIK